MRLTPLAMLLLALAVPAAAQTPPTLTRVQITQPQGTPQNPFRTNRDLISLEFSSDAANGIFFATSRGADIPMSAFLVNNTSGKVGAGFLREGVFNISVLVSTTTNITSAQPLSVESPAITVVIDKTPPNLTITQIKLRPNGAFEGFDPNRQYRTNADQIVLRGVVNDGANGVAASTITISTAGVMQPSQTTADASGQWELIVSIAGEPDGPIDLRVVANDNVVTAREGNRVEVPVGLR